MLWTPQGRLALKEVSGAVVDRIRDSLSQQLSSAAARSLEQRIHDEYLRIFTPTGQLRRGKEAPLLVGLRTQLQEIQDREEEAREVCELFEAKSTEVRRRMAERQQAAEEERRLEQRLRELRKQAEQFNRLKAEREQFQAQAKAAETEHDQLRRQIAEIARLRKELRRVEEELRQQREELPLVEAEEKRLREGEEQAQKALAEARRARAAVEGLREQVAAAYQLERVAAERSELGEVFEKVQREQEKITAWQAEASSSKAPSAEELSRLREILQQRETVRAQLEAALIHVEVEPLRDLTVFSEEAGGKSEVVPAGRTVHFEGSPSVSVEIRGVARIRARGPAAAVPELRETLAELEQGLDDLRRRLGTDDVRQLEQRFAEHERRQQLIREAVARVQAWLGGRRVEDVATAMAEREEILASLWDRYPQWEEAPPNARVLEEEADRARTVAEKKLAVAEQAWSEVREQRSKAERKLDKCREKLAANELRRDALQQQLEMALSDGRTDEEREALARELALRWEAARHRLAQVEQQLSQFGGDPSRQVQTLEAQREKLREKADRALAEEQRAQGELERLATEAPYSLLSAIEEERRACEEKLEREQLRAQAIALLYRTLEHCRQEALASVARPLEDRVSRLLEEVAGRPLGQVQLGGTLSATAVQPEKMSEAVELDHLSGGEQEQLHLLVRLALAETLAQAERQLVVLDDALVVTDRTRLERLLALLEAEAERVQVLVLTCHPERYGAWSGKAAFFELERIVEGVQKRA